MADGLTGPAIHNRKTFVIGWDSGSRAFLFENSIVQVVSRNHLKQVTGKLGFVHAQGFRPLAQPRHGSDLP